MDKKMLKIVIILLKILDKKEKFFFLEKYF